MNKSKMILAASGGVIGLLTLVMAYLVWDAFSAKTAALEGDEEEGTDGLETVVAKAGTLSRKGVYPCKTSVELVNSNKATVAAWKDEAFKLAARGDRTVKPTTPAQFKTEIVADAKRLVSLPGGVQGLVAKPDFAFGPFKEYIVEGKMPAEAKLAELQRQWDDVATVIETLAGCGVFEVVDVQLKGAAKAEEEEAANSRRKAKGRNGRGKAEETAAKGPAANTWVVTYTTRPQGLVKSLNAFVTGERFTVVEGFTFSREKDVIAEAIGGGDKKQAEQQSSGRRRRRAAVVEEKKEEEEPKNAIITDPLMDAPIKVEMTLTVYDFRTLEEEKTEEEKK